MIFVFVGGVASSIISHQILGYDINQWQYWAVSLPIIFIGVIADKGFRKC